MLCDIVLALQRTSALQTNPPSVVCGSRPVYAHRVGRHHRNVELGWRRWWSQARNHAQIGLGVLPACDKLRDGNVSCVVICKEHRDLRIWRDGYMVQYVICIHAVLCLDSAGPQRTRVIYHGLNLAYSQTEAGVIFEARWCSHYGG